MSYTMMKASDVDPAYVRKLITESKLRNDAASKAISKLVDISGGLPSSLAADALEAFCVGLQRVYDDCSPAPRNMPLLVNANSRPRVSKHFETVQLCLEGIAGMTYAFVTIPEMERTLTRLWPKTLPVFVHIHENYIRNIDYTAMGIRDRLFILVGGAVWAMTNCDAFTKSNLYESRFMSFIVKLWLDDEIEHHIFCCTSACIVSLIEIDNRKCHMMLEKLVQEGGGADHVADRLLKALSTAMNSSSPNYESVGMIGNFINSLTQNITLRNALVKKQWPSIFTAVLIQWSQAGSTQYLQDTFHAVAAGKFLEFYLTSMDNRIDFAWSIKSIRVGFMDALVDLQPLFLRDEYAKTTAQDLFKIMYPIYFVFRSFATASQNAMAKSYTPRVHEKVTKGPLAKEWEIYHTVLLEYIIYKRIYDLLWKPRLQTASYCDFCKATTEEKLLKKCSACLVAKYCSKECQRSAWKQHKGVCGDVALVGENALSSSKHDANFLRLLPIMMVDRHYKGLEAHAKKKHPSLAWGELGVVVDLTSYPPLLDVFPLKEAANDPSRPAHVRTLAGRAMQFNSPASILLTSNCYARDDRLQLEETLEGKIGVITGARIHMPGMLWNECSRCAPDSPRHSVPRTVFEDSKGTKIKAERDRIDQVLDVLGFKCATDWLVRSPGKPADLVKALHEKIDEGIDLWKEEYAMSQALYDSTTER